MGKTIYCYYRETGIYKGEDIADESPMEPGKYLLPADSTFTPPPKEVENHYRVFNNEKWGYVPITDPYGTVSDDPKPTLKDIYDEYDRRILSLEVTYAFKNVSIKYNIEQNLLYWEKIKDIAQLLVLTQQGNVAIKVNFYPDIFEVEALEWLSFMLFIKLKKHELSLSAVKLTQLETIPDDYKSDTYW